MSVNNTKYGVGTLNSNSGSNNTAIGAYNLLNNLDASNNTSVGSNAMYFNTSGPNNTAIGSGSLCNNNTGALNTAVGSSALEGLTQGSTIGDENVGLGVQSLYNSDGGSQNTATGSYSLYNMLQGNKNTALGYKTGYNDLLGSYNTYLGALTDTSDNTITYDYSTALGYGAIIDVSNQIMMGGNLSGEYPTVVVPGSMDASAIYLPNTKLVSDYADNEVVPKSYVDTAAQGLDVKAPCQCIAYGQSYIDNNSVTIDFLNNGYTYKLPITIDGYTLTVTSPPTRVLFSNQSYPETTANIYNGIYDVSGNTSPTLITFVRSLDMQDGSDALGAYTFIEYGTQYTTTSWIQNQRINNLGTPVVVGTNPLLFQEYQSFKYRLGRGLDLYYNSSTNYTYLNVDTSLNFINYLDNSTTEQDPNNPGTNLGTMNIGYNTTTTYIGGSNKVNITGYTTFTHDISLNSLTVGNGSGNISTNTVVGYQALNKNTSGGNNVALGYHALYNSTTGDFNVATGRDSLYSNTTGDYNVASGNQSLNKNTSGQYNTAIGYQALLNTTTTSYKTALGNNAGTNDSSGSYNTFLGADADINNSSSTYQYSTAIGYNALINGSHKIILGSTNEGVSCPGGYLGIGLYNKSGTYALGVNGTAISDGWVKTSDYRIKEKVSLLDDTFVVDKLKPVTYINIKTQKQDIGFIAHELQEVYPFLVNGTKNGEDLQSVNYTGLIGILTKEIKELKERVKILENK